MKADQITDFIDRNRQLVEEWADREEKRVEKIKLPYTEADYDRMYKNIMEAIREKELLKRLLG